MEELRSTEIAFGFHILCVCSTTLLRKVDQFLHQASPAAWRSAFHRRVRSRSRQHHGERAEGGRREKAGCRTSECSQNQHFITSLFSLSQPTKLAALSRMTTRPQSRFQISESKNELIPKKSGFPKFGIGYCALSDQLRCKEEETGRGTPG